MVTNRPAGARARAGRWAWWAGIGLVPVAAVVILRTLDPDALRSVVATMVADPLGVVVVLGAYATAFVLRSVAWVRVLPGLPLRHALAAIHVSVGANHVLPLRLGEVLRVTSVIRRAAVGRGAAIASTVTLRGADVAAVGLLAVLLGPGVAADVLGGGGPWLVAASLAVVVGGTLWLVRHRQERIGSLRIPGPLVLGMVTVSWVLEAVVIHRAAAWAGYPISPVEAVVVTAVTIAAQVLAVAPGGLGTYEAAATAALATLGVPAGAALSIAVAAHGLKTGYALVTGATAALWPAPSLFGRFRLPSAPRPSGAPAAPAGGPTGREPERGARPGAAGTRAVPAAPIVLFLPAHDEEESVGAVVARVPAAIGDHPVSCIVIDDGSSDRTAERARNAGAEVVGLDGHEGLGAAVRRGLAEGVARGAAAVAFCDADGEYAPEELAVVVGPVLRREADYVVGSRFSGRIDRMLPHRRLGNRVLTAVFRFVSRTPVTDFQSGYRALSPDAAAAARVIHDFNYAQVLTLDLLARGARYAEVPISYRFRERGRSFVRLGGYLSAVLPAVHRQVNTPVSPLTRSGGVVELP